MMCSVIGSSFEAAGLLRRTSTPQADTEHYRLKSPTGGSINPAPTSAAEAAEACMPASSRDGLT